VEAPSLEIQVESDILVDSGAASRPLMDVIRRQLRQRGGRQRKALGNGEIPVILETRDGKHRMPQGLLPLVTEACIRKRVPYKVEDLRQVVPCSSPLRCVSQLAGAEEATLKQLLKRECGILVAPRDSLEPIAADLLTRRQQRTLVLARGRDGVARWLEALARALDLAHPDITPLSGAQPETRVVVARYRDMRNRDFAPLNRDFGMVVFDGLHRVEAALVTGAIRAARARYLLGLAEAPEREDGLQDQIFLALGGDAKRLEPPPSALSKLALAHRARLTDFHFDYQGRSQYQALVAALARDEDRAAMISADLQREAAAGHPCVVLSDRRDHLERLARTLEEAGLEVGCLTSSVRPAERRRLVERLERGELTVLLSMRQIAQEMLETARFSRLYLTFPFKHLQRLGRVIDHLLTPFPGQTDAVLVDYNDHKVAPLERSFAERQQTVRKLCKKADKDRRAEAQLDLPF